MGVNSIKKGHDCGGRVVIALKAPLNLKENHAKKVTFPKIYES